MPVADTIEIAMRGGAATVALLMAAALARLSKGASAARLGALFALGSAAYALLSSPILGEALAPIRPALRFLAVYNSVFLWWFAAALLDDGFQWRAFRFAPAVVITVVELARVFGSARFGAIGEMLMQAVVLVLMVDALVLAVRGLRGDLVEPRRRFRVAFVALTGTMGFAIAVVELVQLRGPIPEILTRLHALSLLVLAFGFAFWMLVVRSELFATARRPEAETALAPTDRVAPEDRALLERLNAAMDAGVYTEPGLTVAALATRLGAQEHRLRKVINQGLGYRNFTSFLNARRLADAKVILSDPVQARRQVLQIALNLGYGSIGPFNRAFKDATGATPTEFRKSVLSKGSATA